MWELCADTFWIVFTGSKEVRHKEDGTIVLNIHAVCDSVVCNDAVITHELTIKMQEDGSVQYLGNKILDDGMDHIPGYQYRLNNLNL